MSKQLDAAFFAERTESARKRFNAAQQSLDMSKLERLRARHDSLHARCASLAQRIAEVQAEVRQHWHAMHGHRPEAVTFLAQPLDSIAGTPTDQLAGLGIDAEAFDQWIAARKRSAFLQGEAATASAEYQRSCGFMTRIESYVSEVTR